METIDRGLLTFLLNALWQAPLAAAVAALACRAMRDGPARHRHLVWVAALVAQLLLPLASVRRGQIDAPVLEAPQRSSPVALADAAVPSAQATATAPRVSPRVVPVARRVAGGVVGLYFLFVVFRLFLLVRAGFRTARIRAAAGPVSGLLVERVWARCAAVFGIRAELRSSHLLAGPVTAGRTVILPAGLLAESSNDLLTTAIAHEMAHVCRRDFALNLFYEALYIPLAFHPAAWWTRREISRTREMACDEMVVERLLEPRVYAQSILDIATRAGGVTRHGYALGAFDGDILEERIRRLLQRPVAGLRRARLMLAAGVSALAACVVVASGLAISARAQSAAQPEMKLGAAAFNRGDYRGAAAHFERAVATDPGYAMARLHLANALIREHITTVVPSANESEEAPLLKRAKEQYREILARDPKNTAAMFGLASLNGPDRVRESRELMLRAVEIDPKNRNAYYTLGTLDWQLAYKGIERAGRASRGWLVVTQLPDPSLRKALRDEWMPYLEEAFRVLQIARQMDAGDSKPLAYLNLVSRAKAMIVDRAAEANELIEQGDAFIREAMAMHSGRKREALTPTVNEDEVPPQLVPPPPPPPPPPTPPSGQMPPPPPPPARR